MRSRKIQSLVLSVIFLLLFQGPSVQATTIDPFIWEQLVLDSGFVGIAECEMAGGIVAGYKVIESWKGMPVGTRFNLRVATNFWGPQFPITLVGERYLITAYKSQAPTRMMSTTLGTPVPLWWRVIPAEYNIPLWQGRVPFPLIETRNPLAPLGSEHPDLNSFKTAVSELLSLNPEGQEARLLKAIAKKYLFSHLDDQGQTQEQKALSQRIRLAQQKIQKSTSAREIVAELLIIGRSLPQNSRDVITTVFAQGGGGVTLQLLKNSSVENKLWKDNEIQALIAYIERRLGSDSARTKTPEVVERKQPPTEQQLSQMRTILTGGPSSDRFGEAFEFLTRHDPGPVAEFLIKWTNPQKDWQDTDYGYIIGSYFTAHCGKDREANLQKLLQAQDPFTRVAGAVYLTFENSAAGMAKLEELIKLPGDPGVWAALNLSRRGHKGAVPRALEVFSGSGQRGHMSGVPHQNLQLRLMVLLSNSAKASGLPQPNPLNALDDNADADKLKNHQEGVYRYYAEWWQANQSKIQLSDPWLKILEQQKID